jgi:hypothetical protein
MNKMRKHIKTAATLALAGALAVSLTGWHDEANLARRLSIEVVEQDQDIDSLRDEVIDLENWLRQARVEMTLAGIRARQAGDRFDQ